MSFINVHTHIFTIKDVPDYFLPGRLIRYLAKTKVSRSFARLLSWAHPFSGDDLLDRYSKFLKISTKKTQAEIFNYLYQTYVRFFEDNNILSEDLSFVVHSMDMQYMGAGKVKRYYIDQLEELYRIKRELGNKILPFVCVDPRRDDILNIVKHYIINNKFSGLKLYPALGFYPDDHRLMPIYELANDRCLPVTFHCSRGGIFYRKETTGIFKNHYKISQKDCEKFTNPKNFKSLAVNFPNMNICLAHYGGEKDWEMYYKNKDQEIYDWNRIVKQLILEHHNVYTDTSYTFYKSKYYPLLKQDLENPNINKKILFGSDFYVLEMDKEESAFLNILEYLDKEDIRLITNDNPKRFLNINKEGDI